MRRAIARVTAGLLALVAVGEAPARATQPSDAFLRVLTREEVRRLPIVQAEAQEYVPLDEIARMFGLSVREDRLAGGVTVAGATGRQIILTANQPVVSVAGRLVSLGTGPVREGTRWLVPLDFLQRALGPALDTRMELRRESRLVVVGDLRVPRVNVRVEAPPGRAVVSFEIRPAAPARVALEPGHLLVTIEADTLDLALPRVSPQDFIQTIEPGPSPTTIRIVPGPKFGLHRATTSQSDPAASRLVVELLPPGTEAPAPAPPEPSAAPTPPAADPLSLPTPGVRTVVIDPGHGGDDTGARGPGGTLEKDVTLAVARRLRTMIESRLGLRVFLTRDDDRTLSLDDRAAYANSQKADVFLSIHANAAARPSLRGAEVYYLGIDPDEADTPGGSAGAQLPALGGGTRSIALVPWDVAQLAYLDESAALAGLVRQALGERVELSDRPVQQLPLRVLVGASMPAVLVEIGYLSNPDQERALASAAYQDQVAQALYDALVRFRARRERTATAGDQAQR